MIFGISRCTILSSPSQAVLSEFPDIRIAFGQSDEYSFVFHKDTSIHGGRVNKGVP